PDRLKNGRDDVYDMVELRADFALGLDAFRPVYDERVARAAEVRVLLAQLEGRVHRQRPADRIMLIGTCLPHLCAPLQVSLHRLDLGRLGVTGRYLVEPAVEGALAGGAVVADENEDQRVLDLTRAFEVIHDAPDLRVRVRHVSRIRLHHPAKEL